RVKTRYSHVVGLAGPDALGPKPPGKPPPPSKPMGPFLPPPSWPFTSAATQNKHPSAAIASINFRMASLPRIRETIELSPSMTARGAACTADLVALIQI